MERLAKVLKIRSEFHCCSYWTTWRLHISDKEKGNLTFIDIMQYMNEVDERKRKTQRKLLFAVICFWVIVYFIFR